MKTDLTVVDAQTDLSICWVHMSEGTFSHVAAHLQDTHLFLLS